MQVINQNNSHHHSEGIDSEKLSMTVRKNLVWILLIFVVANLAAYLTIRWTKDVYESFSELKLDIKQDATGLGIKNVVEDQNLNLVSGEMEQIKSKLFFKRVIDSMDLWVSYYSKGNVLKEERYKTNPFRVEYDRTSTAYRDIPIDFNFVDKDYYTIRIGKDGELIKGKFGTPVIMRGLRITIRKHSDNQAPDENDYFFVLNSRTKLLEYLSNNIHVDPLNFNANTIRISFQDYNADKAYDIVNKIDSLYLSYSYEQKIWPIPRKSNG